MFFRIGKLARIAERSKFRDGESKRQVGAGPRLAPASTIFDYAPA